MQTSMNVGLSSSSGSHDPPFELFGLEPFDSDLKSSLHEGVDFHPYGPR
jgi:hypothetical protein